HRTIAAVPDHFAVDLAPAMRRALDHAPPLVVVEDVAFQLAVNVGRSPHQHTARPVPGGPPMQLAGAIFGPRGRLAVRAVDDALAILQSVVPVGLQERPPPLEELRLAMQFPRTMVEDGHRAPRRVVFDQLAVEQSALEGRALRKPPLGIPREALAYRQLAVQLQAPPHAPLLVALDPLFQLRHGVHWRITECFFCHGGTTGRPAGGPSSSLPVAEENALSPSDDHRGAAGREDLAGRAGDGGDAGGMG